MRRFIGSLIPKTAVTSNFIVICPNIAVVAGHVGIVVVNAHISLIARAYRIDLSASWNAQSSATGRYDMMMFRKEHWKVNVTSLVERVSRYAVVMRNEDRQSKPIMEALIQGLASLPADARQSITFDRGTEFSGWKHLKAGIGAAAWFCDPQAPYQRGTVENTNNRLRKYLPRSTEPPALTNRYLRSICHRLNSTPRKCLGYQTPAEVFETKLMEIQNRLEWNNISGIELHREFKLQRRALVIRCLSSQELLCGKIRYRTAVANWLLCILGARLPLPNRL
jgi:hypothetical protein